MFIFVCSRVRVYECSSFQKRKLVRLENRIWVLIYRISVRIENRISLQDQVSIFVGLECDFLFGLKFVHPKLAPAYVIAKKLVRKDSIQITEIVCTLRLNKLKLCEFCNWFLLTGLNKIFPIANIFFYQT